MRRKIKIFILFICFCSTAQADFVIVNPDVEIDAITSQNLRSIFTMRASRWGNGRPVHVFTLPDRHPIHRNFVKTHLQMFPYQLRIIWDRSVFSGSGYPPSLVPSPQEMIDNVRTKSGAIGYINTMDQVGLQGVKVLEIQ